ncbi:MAG: hypothetical protein WD423_05830 [Rhodothermales bacterium]
MTLLILLAACSSGDVPRDGTGAAERIRPFADNPHYLAWGGVPIFPLGASGYHSWTPISRPGTVGFEAQLDRLARVIDAIGSPHVRGLVRVLPYDPMNHMHDGTVARVLQPWVRLEDGRYDLEHFEPAWEERLRAYLDAALARRIVVSLEIWDDWSVTRGPGGQYDPGEGGAWNAHPFNPRNNVNYGEDMLPRTTAVCEAPFYSTIPARAGIDPVVVLQKRYVDRLLEIAAGYPNVLLKVSNESRAHLDWSRFWAAYVRERAPDVMIGEMPSTNRRDGGGECEDAFSPLTLATDPHYDYVDVAQGVSGHEFGSPREQALEGARRIDVYRQAMARAETPRPLIVSKDYTRGPDGGDVVLWSRFIGGAAAARFHRPGVDQGKDVVAFQHDAVERLGRFIAEVPFWRMQPAPELISLLPNGAGANVLAEANGHVVIQLLDGRTGERLHLELAPGTWTVRWLDPARGREIQRGEAAVAQSSLHVDIPSDLDHQILHLSPNN